MQANAKVTIKCEYNKVLCNLLNGVISNDLHDLETRVQSYGTFQRRIYQIGAFYIVQKQVIHLLNLLFENPSPIISYFN